MREDISFSWLPTFAQRWSHTFSHVILDQALWHPFIILRNLRLIQCHYSQHQDWGLCEVLTLLLSPEGSHAARCFKTEVKTSSFQRKNLALKKPKKTDLIYWSSFWDNHKARISTAASLVADVVLLLSLFNCAEYLKQCHTGYGKLLFLFRSSSVCNTTTQNSEASVPP